MNEFYDGGCCIEPWCPECDWNTVRGILVSPPAPVIADVIYLIANNPIGVFQDHANEYAMYSSTTARWEFCQPVHGQRVSPENAIGCSILRYGPLGWTQLCDTAGTAPVNISVNGIILPVAFPGDVRAITVIQAGVQVGVVDPITGVVTIPLCPAIPPCLPVSTAINGVSMPSTPSGGSITISITQGGLEVGVVDPGTWTVVIPPCLPADLAINGVDIDPIPSGGLLVTTVLYNDSPVGIIDPPTGNVVIPLGYAQPRDSGGAAIGSPVLTTPGSTTNTPIPDSTITLPNGTTTPLLASQPYDTRPLCPMKFVWPERDQYAKWTITADEAGSYTGWTSDGGSGVLTYRTDGVGPYITAAGTIALPIGTLIEVMRTITTADGYWRWAH